MTNIRKKFNKYKKTIMQNNYSLQFDTDNSGDENEITDRFICSCNFSLNQFFNFYVSECTGFSKKEIKELLFKGRKRDEIKILKHAMEDAVKYKLRNELIKEGK